MCYLLHDWLSQLCLLFSPPRNHWPLALTLPLHAIRTLRSLNICATTRTHSGTSAGLNLIRSIPVVTSYGRGQIPRIIAPIEGYRTALPDSHQYGVNNNNIRRICLMLIAHQETRKATKLGLLNARSLRSNSNIICDYVLEHDIDIICLTETWLTPNTILSRKLSFHKATFLSTFRGVRDEGVESECSLRILSVLNELKCGTPNHSTASRWCCLVRPSRQL